MTQRAPAEVQPIIDLRSVSKRFGAAPDLAAQAAIRLGLARPTPIVRAIDRVDLAVNQGEMVGLVGESGCGKSTLGRIVAGVMPPSDGEVLYRGRTLGALSPRERKQAKLRTQMIFQDPSASLNPRLRVSQIISEAPRVHGLIKGSREAVQDYIDTQLRRAGLDPAFRDAFPHEFSGGQRQRIGIARALAVQPDFLVCDESVAALDVSIQAQILNLFMDLREQLDLTYLFISHDLGVIEHISDRVAVMYLGRIVEEAKTDELFANPNHPYTRALLAGVPKMGVGRTAYQTIKGELPSPINPPSGCHFHPRCPHAMKRCAVEQPALRDIAPGRRSACHLNDQ